ncbi:hypothetical protein ENH_00024900 [Eimeria necatrix]|uniref:Uncharacterized protein n=1 Tax=Eimeria necatrix TaxID=51315 RepID=U6MI75_9EIME|nr:hypothetical protein ENH_00024900 [Eimeria necatrix]CDJ62768.1 hypothetical protein ENH_00024900 [Eimeria necatrix]
MGEAVHYEWSPSPTNNRDSGLVPQATRPISGSGLPVIGTGDSDLGGDISSRSQVGVGNLHSKCIGPNRFVPRVVSVSPLCSTPSVRFWRVTQDSDENSPSGDLKFDDRQTSPDAHDESPSQSDAASTEAPRTGAAEKGVSISCEDEASGDTAAAAPEAAADEEDEDSDSNCDHRVYDIVRSDQEGTVTNAEATSAEPHDAHAAAGELAEKHKVERQGRSRWMGPLAGLLETAGKKITSVAGKSDVAANPRVGGLAGEAAASSSKASQPEESRHYRSNLAFWDSNSPHYKDLGKPYDFPSLKADVGP